MMGTDEAIPSPNIWAAPEVYEIENGGVDPDNAIWKAMAAVHDHAGARVLDVGCGSGYHLPILAERAARVIGLEPYRPLLHRAQRRVADHGLTCVEVLSGSAQAMPVDDASIDVLHARWAYFFGPGCEPGLREISRVMAPGGTAFVIDNDATRSTFGQWFTRAWPHFDPSAVERFWRRQGWQRTCVDMRWQFATRSDFEAVVRIEFAPRMAEQIVAEHAGSGVDYAVHLWHRTMSPVRGDA